MPTSPHLSRDAATASHTGGACLEVMGDLLGSLAAIATAVVIMATGFQAADTIVWKVFALMILFRAGHLLPWPMTLARKARPL